MSPSELDQYLAILRNHNVASAQIKTRDGDLAVVFGPEPLPAGTEPTQGGWKGPERLDVIEQDVP